MNNRIHFTIALTLLPWLLYAQDDCTRRTEKIIGEKGSLYTIPCSDMVILDIETYSKYRYLEKQYHAMDSVILGYTTRLDSLDKEHELGKGLLEEKLRNKEDIIEKYRSHSQEITTVLEKCKTDAENFTKVYEDKVAENNRLENKVKNMKRQRKGLLGLSGGLAGALFLVLLL
jgi:hypothetical protein